VTTAAVETLLRCHCFPYPTDFRVTWTSPLSEFTKDRYLSLDAKSHYFQYCQMSDAAQRPDGKGKQRSRKRREKQTGVDRKPEREISTGSKVELRHEGHVKSSATGFYGSQKYDGPTNIGMLLFIKHTPKGSPHAVSAEQRFKCCSCLLMRSAKLKISNWHRRSSLSSLSSKKSQKFHSRNEHERG
jgi:hypothetical protein